MDRRVGSVVPLSHGAPEVVDKIAGPRILPWRQRRDKSFAECVNDEFKKDAPKAVAVAILYKMDNGAYKMLTDQGDIAGGILLIERAKQYLLQENDNRITTA